MPRGSQDDRSESDEERRAAHAKAQALKARETELARRKAIKTASAKAQASAFGPLVTSA